MTDRGESAPRRLSRLEGGTPEPPFDRRVELGGGHTAGHRGARCSPAARSRAGDRSRERSMMRAAGHPVPNRGLHIRGSPPSGRGIPIGALGPGPPRIHDGGAGAVGYRRIDIRGSRDQSIRDRTPGDGPSPLEARVKLVCFDTATDVLACALWHDGECVEHHELAPRGHADRVLSAVDRVLAEAGVARCEARRDRIRSRPRFLHRTPDRGRGRAGPCVRPRPSRGSRFHPRAIAQGALRENGSRRVLVVLDARLGEVYAGRGTGGCGNHAPGPRRKAVPSGRAGGRAGRRWRWVGCGPGWAVCTDALRDGLDTRLERLETDRLPRARDLAALAHRAWEEGLAVPAEGALPVYLRSRVASRPQTGGRLVIRPLELAIGLRHLWAKRRVRFISFISLISVLGIALGVAALITVLSVMNGFERELRGRILGMASHATIARLKGPIPDWRETADLAPRPFVGACRGALRRRTGDAHRGRGGARRPRPGCRARRRAPGVGDLELHGLGGAGRARGRSLPYRGRLDPRDPAPPRPRKPGHRYSPRGKRESRRGWCRAIDASW